MTTIDKLSEFLPEKETIAADLERLELFFTANRVAENKQVPALLTAMSLIRNYVTI